MKAIAYGLTDVGRRREQNEDAFLCLPPLGLFAVADGMGGHAAGEVASRLAIETLEQFIARDSSPLRGEAGSETDRLESAVREANQRIWESILANEEQRGMGTTLVAMLVAGDRMVLAHVGDSRAYVLRDGRLSRLTSDHSWVAEQVRAGLMSDDDAQRHPMRNIVTRALGSRPEVELESAVVDAKPGDVYMLCSDGLNTMLTDPEIEELLAGHPEDPAEACRALVAAANERGGEDNVTVVVLRAA